MNRRTFVKNTAFGAAALGFGSGSLPAEPAAAATPGTPPAPTPPVLQDVTETAATVVWGCGRPATGWIEYGPTAALGATAHGEEGGLRPFDARVLRVRIDGLQPGRRYFYRVLTAPVDFRNAYDIRRAEAVASPVYSFTTRDATAPEARFVMWNDTHQNVTTLRRLVERLTAIPADFLLWNGDIFNEVATDAMLVGETLHPAGLEYAASRPLVFARGNHDVRGAHARSLVDVLERPEGRYYFAFRQGPLAFIVLDTGEDKDDAAPVYAGLGDFAAYRAEQRAWLERAVAQPAWRDAPFRILVTHIPLRDCPTGRGAEQLHSEDSRMRWEPLLAGARVDLALSGHTHFHHYSAPTPAQPWPLVVGGGPRPDQATYLDVHATANRLSVEMFDLEARRLGAWQFDRRTA